MKKFLSVFLSLALLVTGLSCSIVPTSAYTEPTVKTDYSDCIKFDAEHWGVGGGSNGLSFSAGSVHHNQSAWKAPYTTIEGLAPYTDYTLTFTYDSTCGDNDENTKIELYNKKAYIIAKDSNIADNLYANGYKGQNPVLSTCTEATGSFDYDNTKVTVSFTTTAETTYHLFISIGQCGNPEPKLGNATFHANNFTLDVSTSNDQTNRLKFDLNHWDAATYYNGITFGTNSVKHSTAAWQTIYGLIEGLSPNTEYSLSFTFDSAIKDGKATTALNIYTTKYRYAAVTEQDENLAFTHTTPKATPITNSLNGDGYVGSKTILSHVTLENGTFGSDNTKVTVNFTTTTAPNYNLFISVGACTGTFTANNFKLEKQSYSCWRHEIPDRGYAKETTGYTEIKTATNNWNGVSYELKNLKANTSYIAVVNYSSTVALTAPHYGFQLNECLVTDSKFTPSAGSNFIHVADKHLLYWHAVAHTTSDGDHIGSVNNDTENKQLIYKFTTATAGTYTLLTKLGGTALSLADPVVTEDTGLNNERAAIDQNFSFLGSAIRLASGSKSQALRFKAQVNKAALADNAIAGQTVTEYGFVVFAKSLMPHNSENLIQGIATSQWEKSSITAPAYKTSESKDIIFAEDDNTKQFTAALTNITENNYSKDYVVRIYVKLSNGHTHYVTVPDDITGGVQYYQSSIAAVAQLALDDTNAGYSETDKTTLQAIVTKGGEQ